MEIVLNLDENEMVLTGFTEHSTEKPSLSVGDELLMRVKVYRITHIEATLPEDEPFWSLDFLPVGSVDCVGEIRVTLETIDTKSTIDKSAG